MSRCSCEKPDRPDVKSVRLGRMHIYPFASKRYIELYGLPKNLDEMKHHRLIHQKAPQVEENGVATQLLNLPSIEGIVALRTNASTALAYAIELGHRASARCRPTSWRSAPISSRSISACATRSTSG